MRLSTRLILLVLGCLLPILTAQVYSEVNLYAQRHEQLGALVLRQAQLLNTDLTSIADGVYQLGTLAAQLPGTAQLPVAASGGSGCADRLTAMQHNLTQYRFLALYSATDGTLLCGSGDAPPVLDARLVASQKEAGSPLKVSIGELVSAKNAATPFLPIVTRHGEQTPGAAPRLFVAGLSIDWLAKHLDGVGIDQGPGLSRAALFITDAAGTIVGRAPESASWTGHPLPDWFRPLIDRAVDGVETITDPSGHTYLAAYVPSAVPPKGLSVIEALVLPDLMTDIDQANYQDLLVISGAALAALVLAWVAGRRFIYQPTEALLRAARKWREGDFRVRANLTDAGSEFSALAQSFNAMAAGLEARDIERRMHANILETQVAERTRELSESNNRLQVEIAGREKTEAALHQAQKLQAVGQLAGGIAHDFNNMLATVLGNLELMERRVSQAGEEWSAADSERLQKLIERATGAVTRGGQLTSRLLAFSRRQRLAARPTDVNALLRELITLATSTLGRRIQVIPELADDLWPAMVDPSQVEAAILNLCLNARDAMPEGGQLTITTGNVTMSANSGNNDLASGSYVRIAISDTGAGMEPEVKARAFDPFFTTKGPSAGSGLGLSQVYGMARQSGGSVTLDSAPGEGTRVILTLPCATQSEAAEAVAPERLPPVPSDGMQSELIMVVDDDNAVRQVTVEMARDLGCEVAQAAGGEQALALIGRLSQQPKIILLDYAMPGMNGLQLARALRAHGVTAPIALVTGFAELSEADLVGANLAGLLRKPFTIRELQALLAQLRVAADSDTSRLETNLAEH